jgi:hypothetical protein
MSRLYGEIEKFLLAGAFIVLAGCGGGADFAGPSGRSIDAKPQEPVDPPPPDPPVPLPAPYSSLTWFWQCDSQVVESPVTSEEDIVVEGVGPHSFSPDKFYGTPISISGNLCAPESIDRDIIFIVDTSGSMGSADPMNNGSCGRLDALQAVIASTPDTSNLGVVLFNSVASTSNSMFATEQELFADLAPGGAFADSICADGGGTNYEVALTGASNLFNSAGRADASKEIYFISDGQPDFDKTGDNEAGALKNSGTTIATVMLGGNDSVLKNQIASRDKNGDPLHAYVNNADQLAATLESLSANEIDSGVLRYRSIGDSNWTELDLLEHLAGFEFNLPSFTIDKNTALDGIEVEYDYFDLRGNQFSSGGKILWNISDGEDI